MTDPFASVSSLTAQRKRRVLDDLAAGNAQAAQRAAIDADTEGAAKREAIHATLARQNQFNVPTALTAENQTTIAAPYDRAAADRSLSLGSHTQALQRQAQAGQAYQDEVAGAIPLAREIGDRQRAEIAWEREQKRLAAEEAAREREERARDREHAALMRELQLEMARMDAEDRRTKAEPTSMEALQKSLGIKGRDAYVAKQAESALTALPHTPGFQRGEMFWPQQHAKATGQIDEGLGAPPGYTEDVLRKQNEERVERILDQRKKSGEGKPKNAAQAGLTAKQVDKIKSSGYYRSIRDKVQAGVGSGTTYEELEAWLQSEYGARYPQTVRLILSEFRPLYPKKKK